MIHPLIKKALAATKESRAVEFKREFDPNSRPQWCEVIKDIVAIANSGGGVIVFGLESDGTPSKIGLESLEKLDPADVANKLESFTGTADWELDVIATKKGRFSLVAFVIGASPWPVVFEKPGSYGLTGGKQSSAFAQGTLYFRHGAKSEPARATDLPRAFKSRLLLERRAWLGGIRKIVSAPTGSRMLIVSPSDPKSARRSSTSVRVTNNPDAAPVLVTRDSGRAKGTFLHEQVSGALFDEINNILDANRILAKDQPHFFLGIPVYYRIYAERELVAPDSKDFEMLLRCALIDNYLPGLYWATKVDAEVFGDVLAHMYLFPKNPQTHYLMRIAILLGHEFCDWLHQRWTEKWGGNTQKPGFYATFAQMKRRMNAVDPVLVASKLTASWVKCFPGERAITPEDLISDRDRARECLSRACQRLFRGEHKNSTLRSVTRDLDYVVHGSSLAASKEKVVAAFHTLVGDRAIGELATEEPEE